MPRHTKKKKPMGKAAYAVRPETKTGRNRGCVELTPSPLLKLIAVELFEFMSSFVVKKHQAPVTIGLIVQRLVAPRPLTG